MEHKDFVTPNRACIILGVHFKTLYNWDTKGYIETFRMLKNIY